MAEMSARFALPWLQPGQAQKELAHNEALATIDTALQAAVVAVAINAPPAGPAVGQSWIVGAAPTGAWAGQAHRLAAWTEGGWRFVAPVPGMRAWSIADGVDARWDGSVWATGVVEASQLRIGGQQVVGPRGAAIAAPAGGAVIDTQSRVAIATILTALSDHGLIAT